VGALHESSEGLHAEFTVSHQGGVVSWSRLNLVSASMREQLVKKLEQTVDGMSWRERLELTCRETAMTARRGAPAVPVTPQPAPGETHLIYPIAPLGESAVIAGDGGGGKTTLAVA